MKLTLTLEDEISILDRYRLVPTELFLIRVLLILQEDGNESLFANYINTLKSAGINLRNILITLQEKGIILKSYSIPLEGKEFNPYDIELNKNFLKNLYKCSFELGKELFDHYPQFTTINGSLVPLRSVSKHFDSLESAFSKYGKYIKWDINRHKEIIELVDWAKDRDIIRMSLSSFILNNSWLDLESIRNGDGTNYNLDAIKLV